MRPLSLRAAVSWLEGAVSLEASQLRAVVAGCGETGSTNTASASRRAAATMSTTAASGPSTDAKKTCRPTKASPTSSTKLRRCSGEYGSREVRRIPGVLPPEYCEDCGAPYFPNPLGEQVHAELPEDAEASPAKFH